VKSLPTFFRGIVLPTSVQVAGARHADLRSMLVVPAQEQPPTVVPEPAALLLGALGVLTLLRRRRVR
jgi:MYXO-CTERM domain-containing protein